MKNHYLILSLILILITACEEKALKINGIIPQPNKIQYSQGSFLIDTKVKIISDDSEDGQRLAGEVHAFFLNDFGMNLNIADEATSASIRLQKTNQEEVQSAYSFSVSKSGVLIQSGTFQGIFYGIQTLKQMLSPTNHEAPPLLPFVEIEDAPAFQWRGMMLDVSRHFFPKDSVKKVIDILAMHKMNKFHWHLVDGIGWRIEIDQYPALTRRGAWRKVKENKQPWEDFELAEAAENASVYGGFYSKEDIKEIVAYAEDRYIDVIPEIEMPGHSEAALMCYPELTCSGNASNGVYCAGEEGTFEFLQNIIDEVVDLFPYEYLHIGGDEVGKEGWLQCEKCRKRMQEEGLEDGEALQSYFVKRMETYIDSKNRKLIGWDEILEGGLPERATVMSWRGFEGGIEAANAGHDVVMSPGSPCYFDHSQGKSEYEPPSWGGYNNLLKVYDFNPIPSAIAEDKEHHILGGQANLWTEQVKTLKHVQYMMLPRICALSEALWTNRDQKKQERFIQKMDQHFDRLSSKGYHYAGSALSPNYVVEYDKAEGNFSLALSNELDLYEIRYTLDGAAPSLESALYTAPIQYDSPIQLHAQCFRKGKPIGFPLKKLFSTGLGDQCKITYTHSYHQTYSAGGNRALLDNQFAIARGDDPAWQGFRQKDFEVVVDLGSEKELSYVGLNFFQHNGTTSVMLPTKVQIAVSPDGETYELVFEEEIETSKSKDPFIQRFEVDFEKQKVAYIKIFAKNRAMLPDWHRKNGDAWLFVDELSVK